MQQIEFSKSCKWPESRGFRGRVGLLVLVAKWPTEANIRSLRVLCKFFLDFFEGGSGETGESGEIGEIG